MTVNISTVLSDEHGEDIAIDITGPTMEDVIEDLEAAGLHILPSQSKTTITIDVADLSEMDPQTREHIESTARAFVAAATAQAAGNALGSGLVAGLSESEQEG